MCVGKEGWGKKGGGGKRGVFFVRFYPDGPDGSRRANFVFGRRKTQLPGQFLFQLYRARPILGVWRLTKGPLASDTVPRRMIRTRTLLYLCVGCNTSWKWLGLIKISKNQN